MLLSYIKNSGPTSKALIYVSISAVILLFTIIFFSANFSPSTYMNILLGCLCALIIIVIFVLKSIFTSSSKYNSILALGPKGLQRKFIYIFTSAAAIPAITITLFSISFFNLGIQSWFNEKVNSVLDHSVNIAKSYIKEHKLGLKNAAFAIAENIDNTYYDLINNPEFFNEVLNAHSEMHSIDEIIVFNSIDKLVISQTAFSFSIILTTIPFKDFERADKGEAVEIGSDPSKIRMLIKLGNHKGLYLIAGKLIDQKILEYVDKSNGAVVEYKTLKTQLIGLEARFFLIFFIVALLIIVLALSFAIVFSSKMIKPIINLVEATSEVQKGNLNVQVNERNTEDELSILSKAFNMMIKQIAHQQRDLALAQRSEAWADVAKRVAHEIKNPLTPIQLSVEMLIRKFKSEVSDPATFVRYTNTVLRHIEEVRNIVTEFTNFAKMPNPVFEKNDIVSLIKEFVEARQGLNDKYTYKFSSNVKSLIIACDKLQISQVINNLLKNSEEALEPLNINPKIISVSLSLNNNELIVSIIDNGKGFPTELLDRITEPYLTTRTKGTGLGLAIVKKIVEDHLGIIEVSNVKEGGANVKLTFDIIKLKEKLT